MSTAAARGSAHLGGSLRGVLVGPRAGFEALFRAADRRGRTGRRVPEGAAPYVLAALGGAAAMALGLRFASLIGARNVGAGSFRWSYFVAALVFAALIWLPAQVIWGVIGRLIARAFKGDPSARDLRIVWGVSEFPFVVGMAILVPLDLVIVGPEAFSSDLLVDPLSKLWAALSIAFGLALLFWSVYLWIRGTATASRIPFRRAVFVTLGGWAILAVIVGAIALATALWAS